MSNRIFITYNLNSEAEENTALRLQTISSLYGLSVALPYRMRNKTSISEETKIRITQSNIFVAFCNTTHSKVLTDELNFASSLKKPIIVIYDKSQGISLGLARKENLLKTAVNFNDTSNALHEIGEFLRKQSNVVKMNKAAKRKQETDNGLNVALLGIGIGLLAAWALSREK